jgi:hypothetical protein
LEREHRRLLGRHLLDLRREQFCHNWQCHGQVINGPVSPPCRASEVAQGCLVGRSRSHRYDFLCIDSDALEPDHASKSELGSSEDTGEVELSDSAIECGFRR